MALIPLRRVFRALWILIALLVLSAVPWTIWQVQRAGWPVKYQAWFIAGIFVFLAIPVSVYEIALHLEYFTRPKLQIRIIRILWMVPIYALDCWLALRFRSAQPVLDAIRECYEAYVVYNFFEYLIAYLTDELGDIAVYYSTKQPVPQLWPLQYVLDPWPMGSDFFWECKKGVMSYVIVRPLMALTTMATSLAGCYGGGGFSYREAYVYITLINNFSQFWSLYCLILMYHGTHDELEPIRPLSKFLCIKMVIFFSYWQGVVIGALVGLGIIRSGPWTTYSSKDIGAGLQDFLICVEMFVAALAHAHAFPPRDYMDQTTWHGPGLTGNLRRMFDVRDVVDDMSLVASDTMFNTTQGLQQVGRRTWQTAHETVIQRPKSLLGKLFYRSDPRTALHPGTASAAHGPPGIAGGGAAYRGVGGGAGGGAQDAGLHHALLDLDFAEGGAGGGSNGGGGRAHQQYRYDSDPDDDVMGDGGGGRFPHDTR